MNVFSIMVLAFIIFVMYKLITEKGYNPVKVIVSGVGVILILVCIKQSPAIIKCLKEHAHIKESFIITLDNNEVVLVDKKNGKMKHKIAKGENDKVINQPVLRENSLVLPIENNREVDVYLEAGIVKQETINQNNIKEEKKYTNEIVNGITTTEWEECSGGTDSCCRMGEHGDYEEVYHEIFRHTLSKGNVVKSVNTSDSTYVANEFNEVYVVKKDDKKITETFLFTSNDKITFMYEKDNMIYMGGEKGFVYAIKTSTNEILWSKQIDETINKYYINGNILYCYNIDKLYEINLEKQSNERVYKIIDGNQFEAYDCEKEKVIWKTKFEGNIKFCPLVLNEGVYSQKVINKF